ncbi:MAG TPA: DUF805 domain-containing protein [Pseudolabrys sp.]|jgi:uncharacterized membrane protein YhaH (DUF805 family)|nr:DUF805 domain-containing protein [Pseudolabrys sp.]
MNFVEAIQSGFSNYVNFSGRAQRSAYWWWALFYFIVLIVADILDVVIFGSPSALYAIATLAMLLPTLAVGVRRLHDTDRSGWWLLIALIPLVGIIVLIIFFVQQGTTGPNRFGPNPLGGA